MSFYFAMLILSAVFVCTTAFFVMANVTSVPREAFPQMDRMRDQERYLASLEQYQSEIDAELQRISLNFD